MTGAIDCSPYLHPFVTICPQSATLMCERVYGTSRCEPMPATDANEPESNWEHSHALAEGDELVDVENDTPITVDDVRDDGSVSCRVWIDQRHGQEYTREVWTENEVRVALRDGLFETTDGQSSELATY